jgi:hypothetical protein
MFRTGNHPISASFLFEAKASTGLLAALGLTHHGKLIASSGAQDGPRLGPGSKREVNPRKSMEKVEIIYKNWDITWVNNGKYP